MPVCSIVKLLPLWCCGRSDALLPSYYQNKVYCSITLAISTWVNSCIISSYKDFIRLWNIQKYHFPYSLFLPKNICYGRSLEVSHMSTTSNNFTFTTTPPTLTLCLLVLSADNLLPIILFVWFDSLRPINNLSVIKGRVFLGWTSTKLGLMILLKDTTQWGSNLQPFGLESSTLPLSHCAPQFVFVIFTHKASSIICSRRQSKILLLFKKITNTAWYFMRIVCWQTILMKYHTLFFSKIRKDVAKFVVCCSLDRRLKA